MVGIIDHSRSLGATFGRSCINIWATIWHTGTNCIPKNRFVCLFGIFFWLGRVAFLLFSEGKWEITDFDKNPVSGLWKSPLLDCFT